MKTKSNGLILSKRFPGFSPFTRFDFPGGLFTLFLRGIMETWVKFYRKSIENGWLKNHKLWAFWCYCLLKATHRKHKQVIGFQEVMLEPGQFIFGLKMAAKETRLTIQNIRTCLHFLKKAGNLTIKSTNKFSLVTVVNWELYQGIQSETNKLTNKPLTNHQQTTNKLLTTNKNVKKGKNVKNEKKEKNSREKFSPPCIEVLTMEFQSKGITGEVGKREAQNFYNFYGSKGWMVGSNKMINWKLAVAGWVSRGNKQKQTEAKTPPGNPPKMTEAEEREYYKVKK